MATLAFPFLILAYFLYVLSRLALCMIPGTGPNTKLLIHLGFRPPWWLLRWHISGAKDLITGPTGPGATESVQGKIYQYLCYKDHIPAKTLAGSVHINDIPLSAYCLAALSARGHRELARQLIQERGLGRFSIMSHSACFGFQLTIEELPDWIEGCY